MVGDDALADRHPSEPDHISAAVLVIGLSLVWYQRSHSPAGSAKKPFLSQAPSSEAGNKFAWVPSYPGATISDIRTKMTRGELSYGFSFRTPDASEKIVSFYQSQCKPPPSRWM